MVTFITSIVQLLIALLVIFLVVRIHKRHKGTKRGRYMFMTIIIIIGITIIASSATVIYSTKNLPKDYQSKISSKIEISPYDKYSTPITKVYEETIKNDKDLSGAILDRKSVV